MITSSILIYIFQSHDIRDSPHYLNEMLHANNMEEATGLNLHTFFLFLTIFFMAFIEMMAIVTCGFIGTFWLARAE